MASKAKETGEGSNFYRTIDISWTSLSCRVVKNSDATQTVHILTDVNGYANSGKLTAIMGPSGAGKTTMV
jgi:ABC-type multidrug transport system ATPase subunit